MLYVAKAYALWYTIFASPATSAATSATIAVAIALASAFLEEADVYGVCGYEEEE